MTFALTIFLSAFLLFQIQPIMGRFILPVYGGSPAVWTTCLLFFQAMLLAGYIHAHGVSSRLSRRMQTGAHMALLGVSALLLILRPDLEGWRPDPHASPIPRILLLLTVSVGLPYFLLAATSPLCQRWFHWRSPGRSPYRLYALSNVGSMLALISYPSLVEPNLPLSTQMRVWIFLYFLFAIGCARCAWLTRRRPVTPLEKASPDPAPPPPSWGAMLEWTALAAAGSAVLMATSNQMCLEVAAFPFLWVLPLAVYLTTFILCFESDRFYRRLAFGPLLLLSGPCAAELLLAPAEIPIATQIFAFSAILFTLCMCCHGELVRSKPHPAHLTRFYLAMAAGGAAGGLLVAGLAPALFDGFYEYNAAVTLAILLVFVSWFRHGSWRERLRRPALLWAPLAVYGLALSLIMGLEPHTYRGGLLLQARNFFGVVSVHAVEPPAEPIPVRYLRHGTVVHGTQLTEPGRTREPTTYFGPGSGPELALRHHPHRRRSAAGPRGLHVGVVGLGTGTVAAYGQPGDCFRYYEINPAVIDVARRYFSYLDESPADVHVVLGDARISLEQEAESDRTTRFDVLIIDAYASDAIPLHLITREAFDLYWDRLQPDGLLVLHISNRYLNLSRVVRGLIEEDDAFACYLETDKVDWYFPSMWVVCGREPTFFDAAPVREARLPWPSDSTPTLRWTDDYAALWSVIQWWGSGG